MKRTDFLSLLPSRSDRPLIGIPLMFSSLQEEEEELQALSWQPPDFIEWRLDAFDPDGKASIKDLEKAREKIHYAFPDLPVLVTLRSQGQGGLFQGNSDEAASYLLSQIKILKPSLIDTEFPGKSEARRPLIQKAHDQEIAVIESYHDPKAPITAETMDSLISEFHDDRGDFVKIASFPRNPEEANALLLLLTSLKAKHPDLPLIFIAMGPYGRFLRCGSRHLTGPISFAASLHPSAPGQIPYRIMKSIFSALYNE
jgi:3-dehydroquinate dehydratase-1